MQIYTSSQAKQDLLKLVDAAHQTHEPVYIVGKHHKAVLISEDDYNAMMETLYLTSIPGLKESILDMNNQPIETYSQHIDL